MKYLNIESKFASLGYDELNSVDKKLVDKAKESVKGSYAPYSGFHVGSAVLLSDGSVVTGSNQENEAYPSGLCAERTAIFYAGARYPESSVRIIAIAAETGGSFVKKPVCPCGACCQVLLESEKRAEAPVKVIMYGTEEVYIVEGISNLLPFSFKLE